MFFVALGTFFDDDVGGFLFMRLGRGQGVEIHASYVQVGQREVEV